MLFRSRTILVTVVLSGLAAIAACSQGSKKALDPSKDSAAYLAALLASQGLADAPADQEAQALKKSSEDTLKSLGVWGEVSKTKSTAPSQGRRIPSAGARQEEAKRQDLLILNPGAEISHVWMGAEKAVGRFELEEWDELVSGAVPADAHTISALLLPDVLKKLQQDGSLALPLLVAGGSIYRAQELCLANLKGECQTTLNNALEGRLEAGKSVKLLPVIKKEGLRLPQSSDEALLVRFVEVNDESLRGVPIPNRFGLCSGKDLEVVTHPGSNMNLGRYADEAFAIYKERYGETEQASMKDFICRAAVADCDMMALALAQKSQESDGQVLIATGAMAQGRILDIVTQNHAWNFSLPDDRRLNRVEVRDETPLTKKPLVYVFNDASRSWAVEKLRSLPNREDWKASRFLDEFLNMEKTQAEQLAASEEDLKNRLPAQPLALGPGFQKSSQGEESYVRTSDDALFIVHRYLYISQAPLGSLVTHVSASQGFSVRMNAPTIDMRGHLQPDRKIVEVELRRDRSQRGYRWPELSQAQAENEAIAFFQVFPAFGTKNASEYFFGKNLENQNLLSDVAALKQGMRKLIEHGGGGQSIYGPQGPQKGFGDFAGTISITQTGALAMVFKPVPSTPALINYWRSKGLKVQALYEVNVAELVYFK